MHDGPGEHNSGSSDQPASGDAEQAITAPTRARLRQSFLSLLILPLIIGFGQLVFFDHGPIERAFAALAYPFQLDNEEGFLLDEALQISKGHFIYNPIDREPYLVANYPPLYQAAMSLFLHRPQPSLFFGRLLVLTSLAGIALGLFIICLRGGQQLFPALLCPLMFVATYECHNWAAYARVDIPALFLSILGLVSFISEDSRSARRFSILFFVLALFTKQSMIVAPAACVLFLLFRDWKTALIYTFYLVLSILIPTLILVALTHGQYWLHTVVYNKNEMEWDSIGRFWLPHLMRFYRWYLVALLLGTLYLITRMLLGKYRVRPESSTADDLADHLVDKAAAVRSSIATPSKKNEVPREFSALERVALISIYFLLAALTIPSLAKVGSAENYLLEPLAAASLFINSIVGFAFWESANARHRWFSRVAGLLLVGVLCVHLNYLFKGFPGGDINVPPPVVLMFSRFVPTPAETRAGGELYGLIAQSNGEVICEDPIFLTLDGRRPPINPFILSQLAKEKKWDQQPFVDDLLDGRYSLIVATVDFDQPGSFSRYTDEMADAIRQSYEPLAEFDLGGDGQKYFVYRPKPKKHRVTNIAKTAELLKLSSARILQDAPRVPNVRLASPVPASVPLLL